MSERGSVSRRRWCHLFLMGWLLVIVSAGLIGSRGFDVVGVVASLVAAAIAIPSTIANYRSDRADIEREKREGLSDAEIAVLAKGRTAFWGVIFCSIVLAIIMWFYGPWFFWAIGLTYGIGFVISLPLVLVAWLIKKRQRSARSQRPYGVS